MAMETYQQHDCNRQCKAGKAGLDWLDAVFEKPQFAFTVPLRKDGRRARFQNAIYFHYASINVHALPTSIDPSDLCFANVYFVARAKICQETSSKAWNKLAEFNTWNKGA
jgi:hypothetical protein